MNELLQTLVAFLAALSAASGAPATVPAPDRPAIAQPVAPMSAPALGQSANAQPPTPTLRTVILPASTAESPKPTGTVEVKGIVQSIRGAVVYINDQPIVLDQNARVKGRLVVGSYAEIEGTRVGTVLFAREVEVKGADDNHSSDLSPTQTPQAPQATKTAAPRATKEVKIRGTLELVQGNLIVVNGQRIAIGPNAKIKGTLKPGAIVEIEATLAGTTVIAREVRVENLSSAKPRASETPEVKSSDDKSKHNDGSKNKPEVKSSDDKSKHNDDSKNKPEVKSSDDKSKHNDDSKPDDKSKHNDDSRNESDRDDDDEDDD